MIEGVRCSDRFTLHAVHRRRSRAADVRVELSQGSFKFNDRLCLDHTIDFVFVFPSVNAPHHDSACGVSKPGQAFREVQAVALFELSASGEKFEIELQILLASLVTELGDAIGVNRVVEFFEPIHVRSSVWHSSSSRPSCRILHRYTPHSPRDVNPSHRARLLPTHPTPLRRVPFRRTQTATMQLSTCPSVPHRRCTLVRKPLPPRALRRDSREAIHR